MDLLKALAICGVFLSSVDRLAADEIPQKCRRLLVRHADDR